MQEVARRNGSLSALCSLIDLARNTGGGARRECRVNRGRRIIRECERSERFLFSAPIDGAARSEGDPPRGIVMADERTRRRIVLVSKSSYYICVINCPVCLTCDD